MTEYDVKDGVPVPYSPAEETAIHQKQLADVRASIPEKAKAYRDQRMQTIVTYNSIEASNTPETRYAISSIIEFLLAKNDQNTLIDWRGPHGWYQAHLKDLQGLLILCNQRTQAAFSAEKAVVEAHGIVPYDNWAAAKAAFDTAMGG